MAFVEPTTCLTANCAVGRTRVGVSDPAELRSEYAGLVSAQHERTRVGVSDPAELRSQYAGLVSAQHATAVVAFNREVDDDFLTVDIDGPAVWHLTHQPPPLIVETVLSSSAA